MVSLKGSPLEEIGKNFFKIISNMLLKTFEHPVVSFHKFFLLSACDTAVD